MSLFQRRKALREKAERFASGESIALTKKFDQGVRWKIMFAIGDCAPDFLAYDPPARVRLLIQRMHGVLLRRYGRPSLASGTDQLNDLGKFVVESATEDEIIDVLGAYFEAIEPVKPSRLFGEEPPEAATFRERINEILDHHDIAYQVVGSEVVPRELMAMHSEVVAPALSLLNEDPVLDKVGRAYHKALTELKPGGDPSDAITDAATAFQEMLLALGATGNSLGPLLKDARRIELLGPYDSKLAEGAQLIGEWVSADRSTRGDTHSVTNTDRDDAWLAVHVVGALILRLEKRR